MVWLAHSNQYSLSSSPMLEQAELSLLLVDLWLGLSISSLRFACKMKPVSMSISQNLCSQATLSPDKKAIQHYTTKSAESTTQGIHWCIFLCVIFFYLCKSVEESVIHGCLARIAEQGCDIAGRSTRDVCLTGWRLLYWNSTCSSHRHTVP